MPIGQSLADFQSAVSQCNSLIANAHLALIATPPTLSNRDVEQITQAAFLNMFIAWEEFVEAAISDFMMGEATLGGTSPTRYVTPPTVVHGKKMVIHTNRYFDFANHENVKKIASIFFEAGYPFDTTVNSITQELSDLKTIRNACAHMSSTTITALEGLAVKIFGSPMPGISVYQMLVTQDPRTTPIVTVFASYRDKLLLAAELIANG